jgi:hypothetical protein
MYWGTMNRDGPSNNETYVREVLRLQKKIWTATFNVACQIKCRR